MKTAAGMAIAFAVLSPFAAAADAERLFLGRGGVMPSISAATGLGTASAEILARVTEADAVFFCRESAEEASHAITDAELRDCVAATLAENAGQTFRLAADCPAGRLTSHDGETYHFAGVWDGDDWNRGWSKWVNQAGEVQPFVRASIGYALPNQFERLCPGGVAKLDLHGGEGGAAPITRATYVAENPHPWMHNGSVVAVDTANGVIAYWEPKRSLRGLVREGDILFQGRIRHGGSVHGTAYTFKKGCDPAPYTVDGWYDGSADRFALQGAAPVRKGCAVVGYSEDSPNARLVFENTPSD